MTPVSRATAGADPDPPIRTTPRSCGASARPGRGGWVAGRMGIRKAAAEKEVPPVLGTILIVLLVLLLLGALPLWPYSTGWGYYPSGILGLVLAVLLVLVLLGGI